MPSTTLPSFLVRLLTVANSTYTNCSELTRLNFKRLGLSLLFTVTICGTVLAASLCEFWFDKNYYLMPFVFIFTASFYYILDQAIIMGDTNRNSLWFKRMRIIMALVLGLFNSLLIDYYFFKADIDAARHTEILQEQSMVGSRYDQQIQQKDQYKMIMLKSVDDLELRLSSQLDSLNAEANGIGGSKKRGIAAVWLAKYKSYQADSVRFSESVIHKREGAEKIGKEMDQLRLDKEKEIALVLPTVSYGINKSLELLHKVVWEDVKFMNMLMSVLILLISMLLELVPLIAKSFYDIEEYFEVASHQKEICTTNAGIRKQNAISKEATKLLNENALESAMQMREHKMHLLREEMANKRKAIDGAEAFMDDLIAIEKRWKMKYPCLIDKYGKPIIEKAYETLAVAV